MKKPISEETESSSNNPEENIESQTLDNFCVICHAPINQGDVLRKIKKCSHSFHLECLDRWLETKINMPYCRTDIRLNREPTEGAASE